MEVKLLGHTQLSTEFIKSLNDTILELNVSDGQMIALTAIRTCYSHLNPSEILSKEAEKYFGNGGKEGERLLNHIVNSGHTSTLEHISFTFAIENVSRSLLAQLTRHRVGFSYSVQSQRYVKFGSKDRSEGASFVVPDSFYEKLNSLQVDRFFDYIQEVYDFVRSKGISAEDARAILPNATACNLVMTVNLRSLLDFYSKRNPDTHAQKEIQVLAEMLKEKVIQAMPWTKPFFAVEVKDEN